MRRDCRGRCSRGQRRGLKVPLVVRLEGTNVEAGNKIINSSGLDVIAANNLKEGAEKIVKAVKG